MEFVKDLYQAICDCFEVYHLNRISWNCYADNPAIRGYRNFVKKHGGRECAYFRQYIKLRDGKLHDSVSFEILAEDFNGRSLNNKRTNADRIRSMSDEELVEWLTSITDDAQSDAKSKCDYQWSEWLQSEVEE